MWAVITLIASSTILVWSGLVWDWSNHNTTTRIIITESSTGISVVPVHGGFGLNWVTSMHGKDPLLAPFCHKETAKEMKCPYWGAFGVLTGTWSGPVLISASQEL